MAWKAESRTARRRQDAPWVARLLAIVVPMASIVLLLAALPARAAEVGIPPLLTSPFADEFEEEGEEEGAEICEEVEEGLEICEEGPAEEGASRAPDECLLRNADARVQVSASGARLRLVIAYRSTAPGTVSIDFFLRGAKGPLRLGSVRRHFSRHGGQLRVNERLKGRQIEKARAARSFVVRMQIPMTPGYCRPYNTKRLTVMKYVHGKPVWFQAGART